MYLGSVRFFKNLIFLTVCILILIPTLLAVKYYRQSVTLSEQTQVTDDNAPQLGSPDTVFEPDASPAALSAAPEDAAEPPTGEAAAENILPVADRPAYEDLYPDFYAPQPYGASERVENTIYLTFDDGPSDRTDEILRVLAEKDVKATFFVIGKSDAADLERMRRIVLDEFDKNFGQIREATGTTPTVFRCPGGSINGYDGAFYQEILSEMIRRGFVPFDWNISSEDAATSRIQAAATLTANVVRGAQGKVRGFVLFHDSEQKTSTPAALGPAIDQLRGMGFSFAAITPSTMPVLYSYPDNNAG